MNAMYDAVGVGSTIKQEAPDPHLVSLGKSMDAGMVAASQNLNRLQSLCDRLFGPSPQGVEGKDTSSTATGHLARLSDIQSSTNVLNDRIAGLINRLEMLA